MKFRINRSPLKIDRRFVKFEALLLALILAVTVTTGYLKADTGTCTGQPITLPFTDVPGTDPFFCFIAQLYFLRITLGTSPTTYDPTGNVRRDQMAAFLNRTHDSALRRGSRRAALKQFWTTTPNYTVTQGSGMLGTTAVGSGPTLVASDGADLWVVNRTSPTISRVRASDGQLLGTWTGATNGSGLVVAMGRIFVVADTNPGSLYVIDPSQPPGAVTTISNSLGSTPIDIAFDGQRLWTANFSTVSIITPGSPFTVTNVPGFGNLHGILYDGTNIWVTEAGNPPASTAGQLKKLDANGNVIATVTVGNNPFIPVYDGTNIWVPNNDSNSVSVVRPTDGMVLATLTGNGLSGPYAAAFDGQRVIITNPGGQSVSLFRAADFAPLGSFSTGAGSDPNGVASDGINFWIALYSANKLARF